MALTVIKPSGIDTSGNYTVTGMNVSANLSVANLTVTTSSNLGAVGNVIITGGTAGQYLETNGSGVLTWSTVASGSTSNISNGNSNVNIPTSNGNINLTAVGNTTMVITGTGVNVAGTLNASGNVTVGNLVTSGGGGTLSNINVVSANTFTASGNITAGNANLGNSVTANYFTGTFYGTANLATYATTANSVAGANVSGQVGNALISGTVYSNAQPNITSVGTLTSLDVTGNITSGNANLGNLVTANFFTGNGSLLTGITVSAGNTIVNGNSNVTVTANGNVTTSVSGNANILIVTGTGVNVAGTLNVTGNATVGNIVTSGSGGNVSNVNVISANTFIASGNITANNINTTGSGGNIGNANVISANIFTASGNITAGNANLGNAVTANFFIGSGANLTSIPAGNISGQVANSLIAGTVYTASQPNITSVGTLTSLAVTGNVTSGNANLGNLVTANFFSGNGSLLTGITVSAGNSIVNGNSNVSVVANGNITMSSAGNANIVIVTGTGMNIAGTLNATGNTTLGNLVTSGSGGNITNANVISGNTFIASGNITAGNITTGAGSGGNITGANVISANIVTATISANLGNSVTANFFIGSGANLTSIPAGNISGQVANSLIAGTVYTNAQPNITSTGTLVNLTVSGNVALSGANVSLGAVGNLKITGGTANYILQTDGAGNLSWAAGASGSNISNGNSNVNIPAANGNVNISSAGNANILIITGTGANITGYANVSGNLSVGNITTGGGTGGNITGANVISANIVTATLSANLGNSVTANYFIGSGANLTSLPAGNISGQVTNALISSTVYTNAQPNITSVGTLSSLAVTGNITSGNANLGNLVTANFFSGNGSLLTGITVSAGNSIVNGNSNVSVVANGNVTISSAGNANIVVVTGTGANVTGTLNVTGNTTVANLSTSGSGGNISNVNVISANTFIASGNITANNINTTGSGGNIGNANVISANTFTASGNITAGNATLGNSVTANYFTGNFYGTANLATFATTANAVAGGNVSGQVGNSLVAGTVYTAAQPNITSVGTLTSLVVSGAGSFGANVNLNSFNITSLATPVASTDAATKQYVDDVAQGLNIHDAAAAATPDTLANVTSGTVTYNNGSSGVGANLTTTGSFNLIDGVNVQTSGTRILVKNEANAVHNGIYTWSNATVITRATDYNSVPEVEAGDFVFVTGGTLYDNTGWVQTSTVSAIGTAGNNIEFTQFSGAGTYTAGTGLTLTGSVFSISNTAVTSGSYGNGDSVATFTVNGQGQLTAAANVVITANAANLTGTTLNASVVTSSLTSVGTLTGLTSNGIVNFANTSNTTLGAVGNVRITGGSNGQYLQTDGTGTLTWSTVSSGSTSNISNGNSNVNIPSSNGNINLTAVGNTTMVVTGTGVNVAGTLNVTGNTTVGNLVTSGSGGTLSNINVVSANTFTASGNITAGNANLGNSVTANYFTGTFYGTANLATYATTANAVAGGNVSGQVGNSLVAGTVYTNAQPNITSTGTLTSLSVTGNITSGNANLGNNVSANFFTGNGSLLTGITVSAGNSIVNGNSNVSVIANGNITLSSAGNANIIVVTGTGANIAGTLNVTGNTTVSNLISSGTGGNISNANVISANTFIASGNISANNITTTGSGGNISNANVISANTFTASGNITAGNANLGNSVTANYFTGNFYGTANSATTATTAGTVTTAAQPNITSTGTLTSLSVTGNITSGNANLGNLVTANFFSGNGSLLTGITVSAGNSIVNGNSNVSVVANANVTISSAGNANIVIVTGTGVNVAGTLNVTGNATVGNIVTSGSGGNVSNVNVISANTFIASGNITANNINTTGSGGNISNANVISANTFTASGNINGADLSLSGNGVFGGNLTVNGTLTYINSTTLSISDPIINLQTGANGAAPTANSGKDVGTALNYYDTSAKIAWMGWDVSNAEIAFGSNVGISAEVVTFTSLANIRSGNASLGNSVTANYFTGNFYGTANSATTAGTVTTNAQPNITSVGTLSALSVTGNANTGNIGATGGYFTTIAGSLTTAAQPNITSVGTLSGLTSTGTVNLTGASNVALGPVANVHITGGSNGQYLQTDGSGILTWATVTSGSTSNISNGNSNVSIATANGNITMSAVGNANIVTVTGTGVNVTGTLNVTGQSNLGAVGNVVITGGTANYVLKTDGSGTLSWVAQTPSANVTVDNFTGNGVQTIFTLSTTPIGINQTSVNYNGATVLRTDYTLANANITFSSAPANGSYIEVTTINLTSGSGGGTSAAAAVGYSLIFGG